MSNRIYPDQGIPKIDIEAASKNWSDEEQKAYDEFIDVLANMINKYRHVLVDDGIQKAEKAV